MEQALRAQVEAVLADMVAEPEQRRGSGRPPILSDALLWSAVLVSVLTGNPTQRTIWRLVTAIGAWGQVPVAVTREAVRKRLVQTGPDTVQDLFVRVTALLAASYPGDATLVPFATGVYALDASTLDRVAKRTATAPDRPLAGRLHALFDLRCQRFARVELTENPVANERTTVPALLAELAPGGLILMDRGYTSFALFDAIVVAGHQVVTRYDKSFTVVHTLTDTAGVIDELGFCGTYRADQGGVLLRRVTVPGPGGSTRTYLTSVLDPILLPPAAIAQLYARRWDIEMAFKIIKRVLRLDLVWSTSFAMNQLQVWATLVVFQVASALRQEIARRAGVDIAEVSLEILLKDLPHYVARDDPDVIGYIVARAPYGGIIRPVRRVTLEIPTALPVTPPPPDLPSTRPHRYARKA